jgi:hypothetical protein
MNRTKKSKQYHLGPAKTADAWDVERIENEEDGSIISKLPVKKLKNSPDELILAILKVVNRCVIS